MEKYDFTGIEDWGADEYEELFETESSEDENQRYMRELSEELKLEEKIRLEEMFGNDSQ